MARRGRVDFGESSVPAAPCHVPHAALAGGVVSGGSSRLPSLLWASARIRTGSGSHGAAADFDGGNLQIGDLDQARRIAPQLSGTSPKRRQLCDDQRPEDLG